MIINDWYVWRLRKKPSKIRPYRIMVSTPPSHGGNRGSNPLRVTTSQQTMLHSKIPLIWVGFFHMLRCCSLSQKGHARLACSVVNALATARGRYHLFASAPAAQKISKLFTLSTSEQSYFASTYFFAKNKSTARFLVPSLSQKGTLASSVRLQARFNNAFGSLPPFCDYAPAARLKHLLLLHFWLSPVRALAPRRGKSFWLAAFSCEKTASLFGLPILFPKRSRLLRMPLWARA